MSKAIDLIRCARAIVVATAVLAANAAPAGATSPGVNGRIAFMRGDTGHWQVWVANAEDASVVIVAGPRTDFFPGEADALAHWLDRQPALHADTADKASAERGKQLFESVEVGCAACHAQAAAPNHPGSGQSFDSARQYALAGNQACRACHDRVYETYERSVHANRVREGMAAAINPFDEYAIEEAVRLKERMPGSTVSGMAKNSRSQCIR